jgi:hypothetical protein
MAEALDSVPEEQEERTDRIEQRVLAEVAKMFHSRPETPRPEVAHFDPHGPDLTEGPTQNEPHPRAKRARDDDGPLPIPAVILPSTPDGRPPVLTPSQELPAVIRSTPVPVPLAVEPPKPSGRVHIANGTTRDVIDLPIASPVSPEPPPELAAQAGGEVGTIEVITKPSLAPLRSTGERKRHPSGKHELDSIVRASQAAAAAERPSDTDATQRVPALSGPAPDRSRRGALVWAALLGLAIGAGAGLQVAIPAPLARLLPPTAASEVRAGARAAREGDVDQALTHFKLAAELDPNLAQAWRNLGVAYALKGDQVRSEAAYRQYLLLEPTGEQARAVRELLGEQGP